MVQVCLIVHILILTRPVLICLSSSISQCNWGHQQGFLSEISLTQVTIGNGCLLALRNSSELGLAHFFGLIIKGRKKRKSARRVGFSEVDGRADTIDKALPVA